MSAGEEAEARDRRRRFDLWCWGLRARGYSTGFIAILAGSDEHEVGKALRRVECGRYGHVRTGEATRR